MPDKPTSAPASQEPVKTDAPAAAPAAAPTPDAKPAQGELSLLGQAAKDDGDVAVDSEVTEKPGEPNGKQPDATPELKISLPEGVKVDEAVLAEFTAFAKEVGLDSDKASKLAAWDLQRSEKLSASMEESVKKLNADWAKEFETDKEFGGDNTKVSLASAKKALRKFGGEELAVQLDQAGLGNHPGLLKFFARVGKALGEDDSHAPGSPGAGRPSPENFLRKQYPSMFNADGTPK